MIELFTSLISMTSLLIVARAAVRQMIERQGR